MHTSKLTLFLTLLILILIGGFSYGVFFPPPPLETPKAPEPIIFNPGLPLVTSSDPAIGSSKPAHTLLEFGDFECPSCREIAETLDELLENHPDLQLVWKDAPATRIHFFAEAAAVAARCAKEQGKFWVYHHKLMTLPLLSSEALEAAANDTKLEITEWRKCLVASAPLETVRANIRQAETLGIEATPFFFLDGKPLGSLHEKDDFEKALTKNP